MQINVNGQQYNSWDEVPEEVRKLLELTGALPDSDHDGVPDLIAHPTELPAEGTAVSSTNVTVDGVTYNSLDQVPPEIRATLQQAGLLPASPSAPPQAAAIAASGPTFAVQSDGPPSAGVLLNGVPMSANDTAARRRWWRRG